MAVAIDVARGEKTLSQVAAEHGVGPSLSAEWRDGLLDGVDDMFGKTQQERERKRSEEAARRKHGEALRKIGQLAVERGFLRRSCDGNGYGPGTDGDDAPWSAGDERLAALAGREHAAHPACGARKIAHVLRESGEPRATRWRVTRLMGLMGIRPCCPLPPLPAPSKASRRFPCLLCGKAVRFPDQVWSTDIAYVQIGGRRMYLAAVIDWYSRCIVPWRLSDTMRARGAVA